MPRRHRGVPDHLRFSGACRPRGSGARRAYHGPVTVTAPLPVELRLKAGRIGRPALNAAFGPEDLVVAAGQMWVGRAVARFDLDLANPAARTLDAAARVDWQPRRVAARPDGSFLLCHVGRAAERLDGRSL